jgi:hypothetical protein
MYTAWALAIVLAATQQAPAAQIDRTTLSGSAVYTYNGVKAFILKSAPTRMRQRSYCS